MEAQYFAYAGIALIVGFFLWLMFGGKGGSSEPKDNPGGTSATGLWMLVQGDSGPEYVSCTYDDKHHGYLVRGAFYPRELCRHVKNGSGVYMLASHCTMPADGNTEHSGNYHDLTEVTQAGWTASWTDYDRARRRLNADMVWNRGDGSMAGVKTFMNAAMCLCLIVGVITLFSVRGQVARTNDSNVVLSGQIARLTGDLDAGKDAPKQAANKADGSMVPNVKPAAKGGE